MGSQNLNNSLRLTVHFRDGVDKILTKDASNGSGDVLDLKVLCQALRCVQTETNSILTELVEKEREITTPAQNSKQNVVLSDDDDEDDEEEDDDDDDEPPTKQQKT